jgi:hypothetical protein
VVLSIEQLEKQDSHPDRVHDHILKIQDIDDTSVSK